MTSFASVVTCGSLSAIAFRRKFRIEDRGNTMCDSARVSLNLIEKHYHRNFIVDVTRDVRLESLPRAPMLDEPVVARFANRPAKAVGIGIAIVQFHRRPHLFQARSFEQLL